MYDYEEDEELERDLDGIGEDEDLEDDEELQELIIAEDGHVRPGRRKRREEDADEESDSEYEEDEE